MEHQDWTTVSFKKPVKTVTKQPNIDPEVKKFKQLEESDNIIKIVKVSNEDKIKITKLRLAKKLTQEELNVKLCLKKDTIKCIENGTHEYNKLLINKIVNFLIK